jgi:uncharacterized protein YyaL (SSP411 family)
LTAFRFSPRPNRAHLIHWREWDTAAFEEARQHNKLIVVVITAFWCGVCQRLDETALSAADVQVLLNAYFVPIRVEESQRPDVDLRYSREGWPSVVFLNPDAEPILTVNALDAEQLTSLLVQLVAARDQQSAVLVQPAPPIASSPPPPDPALLSTATVNAVVSLLSGLADSTNGGFGGPQKYFHTDALAFFLHLATRTGERRYLDHVCLTLDVLIKRAIYDPTDGAFFRYSSQPDWNEPHRERLLADQAALLRIYLTTFDQVQNPAYRATAEHLIDYLDGTLSLAGSPLLAGCQDFVRSPNDSGWTPFIDGFVYCDANARAASAYFQAADVLGRTDCRERAERMLDALWDTLRAPVGGLYHYADGQPHTSGLLIDSVALGTAMLDGFAATGHTRFTERAAQLAHDILRLHVNPNGGLFDISERGPAALQRPVSVLTQNADAALFFLRLAALRGDTRLHDAVQWALLGYGGGAHVYGAYAASFGHALDLYLRSHAAAS